MLRMTSLRGLLFSLPAPKPANAATSGAARLLLTRGLVSSSGSNQSGTMVTTNRVADPSAIQMVFSEIHCSLDHGDQESRKLTDIATYYFDGKGKVTRPVLTMLMAQALNQHLRLDKDNVIPSLSADQRKIALAAEMYHTASLMHDDVIDHAEMRRGKESVNQLWGQQGSIRAGDYSVAIATKEVAEMKQPEVRKHAQMQLYIKPNVVPNFLSAVYAKSHEASICIPVKAI